LVVVDRVEVLQFRPHYPARGRKHLHHPYTRLNWCRFRPHYPARGRKPSHKPEGLCVQRSSDLITPQGDGNLDQENHYRLQLHVQTSLPRKGTETFNEFGYMMPASCLFRPHYPARGRKHCNMVEPVIHLL